jgi:glycosyltransferase involved in cell wall biosynthesis
LPVHITSEWKWDFVRRAYPRKPVTLDVHVARPKGALTIAWVVPPWGIGSGGHAAIFQLVGQLERLGHKCAIFVFDPFDWNMRPAAELRREINAHFVAVQAPVFRGLSAFHSADVVVATNWWTAFPVRDLSRCREKVYLVQDHEPEFSATSAQSLWAADTYRMGYRCVAYTPWLVDVLKTRYGAEAHYFECGTDTTTYTFAGPEGREPGLIVVYGRAETERRAVELAFAGLATLHDRRPGLRIVLFGSSVPLQVPFPCENLGVVPPEKLAELYRRASAGVVFSLTNLSLVTTEMMASGLPVVELDRENVSSKLGASGDVAMLAEPTPDAIADALERLLDDPANAAKMAARARAFVEPSTWELSGEQLDRLLRGFLAAPRDANAIAPVSDGARRASPQPSTASSRATRTTKTSPR